MTEEKHELKKPNILLVVMDATRYDVLVSNGNIKKPNIKKLADDGVMCKNAFSVSPWTGPSHAALFTGLYPPENSVLCDSNLDLKTKTIAELLKEEGYYTFGISNAYHTSSQKNYDRGFADYFETYNMRKIFGLNYELSGLFIKSILKPFCSLKHRGNYFRKEKTKEFIKKSIRSKKPFFGFVNFGAAHSPYGEVRNKTVGGKKRKFSGKELKKLKGLAARDGYGYMTGKIEVSKEEFEILRSWYDREVSFVDMLIGDLTKFLKKQGMYENTMIIVTADHGENFGEHNLAYHAFCLYNSLLHVPLIIKTAGGLKKQVFPGVVSLVDIPFTIANFLNIELNGEGINILEEKNAREGHEDVFATYIPSRGALGLIEKYGGERGKFENNIMAVITKKWKFIENSDKKDELYDMEKDFDEQENLIDKRPEIALQLKTRISERFPGAFDKIEREDYGKYEEKIKEGLRNLGYLD